MPFIIGFYPDGRPVYLMAGGDDVTVDNGGLSDLNIATDTDASGKDIQLMKMTMSANQSRTHIPADADGLLVNLGAQNKVSVDGTATTRAPLQAGTAAFGKLAANSGVDIGDTDVISVVPGTGGTNLGKARGDAAGATDVGVAGMSVRKDTAADMAGADGDYAPTQMDATGRMRVAAFLPDASGNDLNFATPASLTDAVTIGTGAMAQYDSLHTSAQTITSAVLSSGGSLNIMGAILRDKGAKLTETIRCWFFDANPTSSTFTAEAQLVIHDDDADKVIGWLDFTDWGNGSASSFAKPVPADLPAALKVASGTTLYYCLQLTSATTPTWAGSTDLKLNIPYALQD